MGIQGLHAWIRKNCPESIKESKLSELKNKSIPVDLNGFLYKLNYSKDLNESEDYFIVRFLSLFFRFEKNDIDIIWVLDGEPTPEKSHIKEKREEQKEEKEEKFNKSEEYYKYLLNTFNIDENYHLPVDKFNDEELDSHLSKEFPQLTKIDIGSLKDSYHELKSNKANNISVVEKKHILVKFLKILNTRFVISKEGEAEGTCAILNRLGENVFGAMSDDADTICFGAKKLIRPTKIYQDLITIIDPEIILKKASEMYSTEFTLDMLIEVGILSGCDFCEGHIPQLGIVTAFELISKYKTIEAAFDPKRKQEEEENEKTSFLEPENSNSKKRKSNGSSKGKKKNNNYKIPEGFFDQVKKARNVFYRYTKIENLHDDYKDVLLRPRDRANINKDEVKDFMNSLKISSNDMNMNIGRIIKYINEYSLAKFE